MNTIAIDYKGKYFIIQDKDYPQDPEEDDIISYIDTDKITNDETLLKEHVETCQYYGIPPYYGANQALHDKIDAYYKELDN